MATYTCGPAGTYASIQTCIAASVLVNGDTIQLMAGYSVDERILPSGLSNITIVGNVNNPSGYDVRYSNPLTTHGWKTIEMTNCTNWTFKGFRGRYTGAFTISSGFAHGGYGTNGGHLFEDLIVETSGYYGISGMGSNTTYRRVKIDGSSHTAADNAYLLGPETPGASGTVVESCLVVNSSYLCINLGTTGNPGPTIKNTTVYNNRSVGNNSSMGMYILGDNAKVYNSVVGMDSTFTNDKALFFGTAATATAENCVLYGAYWGDNSDLNSTTGTVSNVVKSSGVSSSAVVFTDAAGGDYTPKTGGLLDETGNAVYAPIGGDLNKSPWGTPPSIGALSAILPPPEKECLGWGVSSFGLDPWGGADREAPVILSVDPPCGSVQVHPCTPITIVVGDPGCSGLNLDCIRITIDGNLIYDGTGLSFAVGTENNGWVAPCDNGSTVTRVSDPTYFYKYTFVIKCTCFTCDKKITMVATFCDDAGNTTTLDCYFTTAPCNFIDDIEIIDSKRYLLRFKNPLKGSIAENPDLYNPDTYTVAPVDLGIANGKEVAVQAVLVEKVNFPQYVIVELTEPTEGAAYQFSASRLITDIYGNLLQEKGRGVAICRNTKLDFILNKLPTVYNRSIVVNGETEISPFYILSPMGIEDERSGGDF